MTSDDAAAHAARGATRPASVFRLPALFIERAVSGRRRWRRRRQRRRWRRVTSWPGGAPALTDRFCAATRLEAVTTPLSAATQRAARGSPRPASAGQPEIRPAGHFPPTGRAFQLFVVGCFPPLSGGRGRTDGGAPFSIEFDAAPCRESEETRDRTHQSPCAECR